MKFAREKRRLLAWLALVAPLPLPLNEPRPTGVVGWPFLALWALVILLYLRRVESGSERWLGPRALNLLGLAYLPFLALDVMSLASSLLIRPMMHLAMFALAAKLFSLERERDKWHALLGIFFIFVTATATSTSIGIVVYLLVFMGLAAMVLARFSSLHMESFEDGERPVQRRPVMGRFLPAAILLMIPIFWFLPRFGQPFLFGEGGGGSSIIGTGFSDEVSLDGIGRIRSSSDVALRLDFGESEPSRSIVGGLRLRGATYDRYQGDGWERTLETSPVRANREGVLEVRSSDTRDAPPVASAEVWLEPLDARAVILPTQTLRVQSDYRESFERNRAGALSFLRAPRGPVSYHVELGARDTQWAEPPTSAREPSLDDSGISERIQALAELVAGDGDEFSRAAQIEQHLQTEYDYELEMLGAGDTGAVERFLFERRAGHCEYFASAMVLMLRSLDIPARFVTGFLGAERSPLGYSIVRQSNAHAWVEAYVEGSGWQVFDPTPPAGRPTASSGSLAELARQAYDWAIFSWDKYVLGFGSGEQQRVWTRLVEWVRALMAVERTEDPALGTGSVAQVPVPVVEVPRSGRFRWEPSAWILIGLVGLVLVMWLRRRRISPQRGYLELRGAARRAGIAPSSGPLEFAAQVGRRVPAAEQPVLNSVVLYLEDSFGAKKLDKESLGRFRCETREAVRLLRRSKTTRPTQSTATRTRARRRREVS